MVAAALAEIPAPPAPLPAYAISYWNAFNALRHDRQVVAVPEMVAGPGGVPVVTARIEEQAIPFTAIDRYAARHGISGERYVRFERLIFALDDEYRAVLAERRAGNTQHDTGETDG